MKKILIIFSVLLSFNFITTSQVYQQWIQSYGSNESIGNFIHTDLFGNVYIVGTLSGMDGPDYTLLAKYNPYGTLLYGTQLDTPCMPVNVYFDGLNNEYIAGYNIIVPAKFTIVKYNSSGFRIWRKLDSCGPNDKMIDLASDISGCPVIIKYKNGINIIIKYDSSGTLQQQFNITDTINPQSLSIDYQNNIIVTGYANLNPGNIYTIVTIKYSSTGGKLWRALCVPPTSSNFFKIKTGNTGNIYVMANSSIIKYNSSGIQQWVRQFSGSSMVLDNYENLYATGSSGTSKYNTSGNLIWNDTTGGMNDLTIDKYYNVYATGSEPYGLSLTMMRTIKLNNNGNKLWTITYASGSPYSDVSHAITLDTTGNVFVTGLIQYEPDGISGIIGTIKYSQALLDTISPKYFPLQVGNVWTYYNFIYMYPGPTSYYSKKIITNIIDTNGYRYYSFFDTHSSSYSYLRIDSLNGRILQYGSPGCPWLNKETLVDSLQSKIYDSCKTRCDSAFTKCTDTSNTNIFGLIKPSKYFNHDYFEFCDDRRYVKDFGLTYTYGCSGVGYGYSTLVGCVINGILYGDTTTIFYSVSGTIRYQDNNQPVSSGYVKDLKLDKNTYQIITLDSVAIQSNGAYSLSHVPKDSTYIMAYGNDEEDFVPTYHDSTIYWQNASVIYPTGNMTNVDVKVFREIPASGQRVISGGVFESQTSLTGVSGAIIYAKLGSQFIRYAISGANGNYLLDSLEQGKYQIFCDRLGYTNGYKVEPLTSFNLDTVDFYLMRIMSVTNVQSILPTSFALYQNYPNPFNPSTTIKFDIPVNVKGEMSNVKLVIYDLLGRKAAVLINENMQPGTYKVEWNAGNYASGLYFYKLSATSGTGEFTETKKLVLLK